MNIANRLALLKRALVIGLAGQLICQAGWLQAARAAETAAAADIQPQWIIRLHLKAPGNAPRRYEFIFSSFHQCRQGALKAKKALRLTLMPVCDFRWSQPSPNTVTEPDRSPPRRLFD